MGLLLVFVCFQASWFACVLGAARGWPLLGPAVVGAWLAAKWKLSRNRRADLLVVLVAGLLGYLFDSVLVLTGVFDFPPAASLGWPTTVWMVALWMNLGGIIEPALGFLKGRYGLAAILGAAGGVLAYLAGSRLGAIELTLAPAASLLWVGLEWALAMPVLLWLSEASRRRFGAATDGPPAVSRTEVLL